MNGLSQEETIQEKSVDLFQVFFGVADCCVSHQSAVLSGKHVNMYLLDLLLFVEICHNGFRTESNGLVGVDVPANHWMFYLHFL